MFLTIQLELFFMPILGKFAKLKKKKKKKKIVMECFLVKLAYSIQIY